MLARKTVCLRRLGGTGKGELRIGRFFANAKVTTERIVAGWSRLTGPACAGRHVLAIQDRTEVRFSTTPERRRGLGPIGHGNIHGVLVHAMVAVDAASGACLGLVGGDVWSRDGVGPVPHRARPFAEKESACWLRTAEQAKRALPVAAQVTVVGDREADIYALWAAAKPGFDVLVRAREDRRLADGGRLFAAAAALPAAGRREIALRPRGPRRPPRVARVELRHGAVAIRRPDHEAGRPLPASVPLQVIDVREIAPPPNVEPLHWRLLTTHRIADAAAAWRIVDWYRQRWVIEQLFRVVKSQGLRLEDSQLASADRLVKLAAVATKAACIDIQLTQERDGKDRLAASTAFDEAEIETLAVLGPTLEGETERQRNPHPPRSLAWAAWCVARLGGWNCYYKPPGPITFRRGMQDFNAIHRGRQLRPRQQQDVRIP